MRTTSPTSSIPSTAPTTSPDRRRRRTLATVAGLLLVGGLLPMTERVATAGPTGTTRPLGGCLLAPAANTAGFDVTALVMTIRKVGDVVEILHEARCTDGRGGAVWIAADII